MSLLHVAAWGDTKQTFGVCDGKQLTLVRVCCIHIMQHSHKRLLFQILLELVVEYYKSFLHPPPSLHLLHFQLIPITLMMATETFARELGQLAGYVASSLHSPRRLLTLVNSVLQTNRVVQVYFGDHPTPYLIQEAVLTTMSEFFVRAFKNEGSHGDEKEKGVIRLPEDNHTAWMTLLYWKLNGKFKISERVDEHEQMQLVHCWTLGNKYDIKAFQDLATLELLNLLEDRNASLAVIQFAFKNTAEGSALRKLMARQVVINIHGEREAVTGRYLEIFNGVSATITELVEVYDLKEERNDDINELRVALDGESDEWRDFMVGGWPDKHWIYELHE